MHFIVLLYDQKYQKSARRTRAVLLSNHRGVHELVARAVRGKCVRHGAELKSAVLPFPMISAIPRVRTYHTKKPSRFVHALSARPHNRVGGRESNACADGTIKISPISLCSHPNFCQNFNREVRHSLTWHSSKSESALERFEPVAVVQQLPDGRGSVFAPVAARRQGEIYKRRNASYMTFGTFGHTKVRQTQSFFMFLAGRRGN